MNEKQAFELPRPSDNEVATLKAKHGAALFEIVIEPSEEGGADGLVFVFKRPDRKVLSAASTAKDDIAAADIVLKNCLVWGEADALEDISVFQAVSQRFQEINKPRIASLKKL